MVAYLDIHTAYDLLNSSLKIRGAVKLAVSEDVDTLTITDASVLYGSPKSCDTYIANNIKLIFDMTICATNRLNNIKAVILAKDNCGLKDLYQLPSEIKVNALEHVSSKLLKRFSNNMTTVFKNVTNERRDIARIFDSHEDTYLGHRSVLVRDIKHVWIQNVCYQTRHDVNTISAPAAIRDNTRLDLIHDRENLGAHSLTKNEIH